MGVTQKVCDIRKIIFLSFDFLICEMRLLTLVPRIVSKDCLRRGEQVAGVHVIVLGILCVCGSAGTEQADGLRYPGNSLSSIVMFLLQAPGIRKVSLGYDRFRNKPCVFSKTLYSLGEDLCGFLKEGDLGYLSTEVSTWRATCDLRMVFSISPCTYTVASMLLLILQNLIIYCLGF